MSSNRHRLTHHEAFDLYTYLKIKETQLTDKWEPLAEIAAEASASLEFYVSEGNLKGALKTAGITRCERPKATHNEDIPGKAMKRLESQIAALSAKIDVFLDSTPQTTGTDSTDEPAKT